MNRAKSIGLLVGVLVLAGVGYVGADMVYLTPASEKRAEIAELTRVNQNYENALRGAAKQKELAQRLGRTMLADDRETVNHRLRTLMTQIGTEAGLSEVVFAPKASADTPVNPASDRKSKLSTSVRKALGKQVDFQVMRGTLTARGSYEQVLAAVETIRAQPWVHRLPQVSISVEGRDRSAFKLVAVVESAFAVGLRPADEPDPVVVPVPEARMTLVADLSGRNPFEMPAPPPVQKDPEPAPVVKKDPPPKPTPPPPPYDKWRVTGVFESGPSLEGGENDEGSGGEVFLSHADGKEGRTLAVGQRILDLEFAGIRDYLAVFRGGEKEFVVAVGESLAQRRPLD